MSRPWTAFYHPQTAPDLPPLRWPHLPAFIAEAVATYRDNPAFTLFLPNGTQGTLTYGQVDQLSDAFAVYLRDVAGLAAGDRVALLMPNCLAYPIAVFGCLKAGLVMVNTNPLYTVPEMVHQFNDSGATVLVAIDVFATKVAEVLPKTSIKTVVLVSVADLLPPLKRFDRPHRAEIREEDGAAGAVRARVVSAARWPRASSGSTAGSDPRRYQQRLTLDSIAALQYTGGTTGVSKGAVLTHGNLLSNIAGSLEMWKPILEEGSEVMLTALPLYHVFAFTVNLMIFFAVGGRNILIPSPRPMTNLKLVMENEPITLFTGLNTLFLALMNEAVVHGEEGLAAEGDDRRRHGARSRGRRALAGGDQDAGCSGLRTDRDVAGRDAQSVPPRQDGVDRRARPWHRRPAGERSRRGRRRSANPASCWFAARR